MENLFSNYSPEVLAALSRLEQECFGKEAMDKTVRWIANLYDKETGGFYITESAKNTEGFYPDLETTAKSIGELCSIGVFEDWNLQNFFPEDKLSRMIEFLRRDQSEEDGYWYERPFGKYINESKKLYQSNAAAPLLVKLGAKPKYMTAPERVKAGLVPPINEAELSEKDILQKNRFNSEEDFRAWFENWLDWEGEIYLAGSLLLSSTALIDSAGYYEYCAELIKEKINSETGLLDAGTGRVDYDTMSGSYKVSAYFLESFKRGYNIEMPYVEKLLESTARVILSDEPLCHACHVTNPWPLLRNALGAQKNLSDAVVRRYHELLPALIDKTREKLLALRAPDGILSYFPGACNNLNQQMVSSLPLWEGQTQGVCMAFAGRQRMYDALNIKPPKIESSYDEKSFLELLDTIPETEKIKPKNSVNLLPSEYENINDIEFIRYSGLVNIVKDKIGDEAIKVKYEGKEVPILVLDIGTERGRGFSYEMEFAISELSDKPSEDIFELQFGSQSYTTVLNFYACKDCFDIYNNSDKSRPAKCGLSPSKRYTLRVEYTYSNEPHNRIYLDGELIACATYHRGKYPEKPAEKNIACVTFRPQKTVYEREIFADIPPAHNNPFELLLYRVSFEEK